MTKVDFYIEQYALQVPDLSKWLNELKEKYREYNPVIEEKLSCLTRNPTPDEWIELVKEYPEFIYKTGRHNITVSFEEGIVDFHTEVE
jgi:hypothetical protein